MVGQIVAFLDRLRQQHFKFYVRCFIGTAKRGHQHFVLGLVPDESQRDFYGRILNVMAQLGGGSANVL